MVVGMVKGVLLDKLNQKHELEQSYHSERLKMFGFGCGSIVGSDSDLLSQLRCKKNRLIFIFSMNIHQGKKRWQNCLCVLCQQFLVGIDHIKYR